MSNFICVVGLDAYGATVLHVRHTFEDDSVFDGVITFPLTFEGDAAAGVAASLAMTANRCRPQHVEASVAGKVSVYDVTNENGMIVIKEGWGDLPLSSMSVIRVIDQAEYFRLFGAMWGPWRREDKALRRERMTIE